MSTRLIVLLVLLMQIGMAAAQEVPAVPSRAQRDADNPLRLIIEAGKLKPRARPAEPDRPPRVPERVQVHPRAAAAPAAPASTALATAAPVTTRSESSTRALETPTSAPEVAVVAPAPSATTTAPAVPEGVAAVAAQPLRLAQMVEPVLSRRLLDKVRGEVEVVVTFTVNPDGSVAGVAVQSSSNKAVNATVLEAVAQWRYAPIPAAREHAVQVVLHQPD